MAAPYTTSTALLEALVSAGVTHLFVNLGSDHPAIIEAISAREISGMTDLKFITAPNEFVGLCAAQGFFQASGKMQAILVHVDAGTYALGGAIHNVSRARIPVIIIAGTSPITDEGELIGGRNEFIHYLQDSIDQRGIVRGYTVYDHEIRSGRNAKQIILRAAQISKSEPQGPSYLIASREALEERIEPYEVNAKKWNPVAPAGLSPASIEEIGNALLKAKSPVVITTYSGRDTAAVKELVTLCERTGTAFLEALPSHMNFPHNHDHYVGNHWSEGLHNSPLETADVVLVLDCDVPWVKMNFKPAPNALIYHIDCDPVKVNMSLFHIDTELSCQANVGVALTQLNAYLTTEKLAPLSTLVSTRTANIKALHDTYISSIKTKEVTPSDEDLITPHYVLSLLRSLIDSNTLILSEGISNYRPIADTLQCSTPGSFFTSGATSLGWHGGAAVGAKLAHPDKTVVAITGDGSFMFSIPSTVHWMARRYDAPFLTIIMNNRGWKSPMLSTMAVNNKGLASTLTPQQMGVSFEPPCDYAAIAVAAGAGWGTMVKKASEVEAALKKGLETVRGGRAAVMDVWLPSFKVGDRVG